MKRAIFLLSAVCMIGLLSGCAAHRCGAVRGSCARATENCVSANAEACPSQECAGEGVQQCGFFEKIKGRGCGHECGSMGCGPCSCGRRNCMSHCGTCCGLPMAYPYYTLRGPRDFLAPCPPSIGP